MRYSVLIIVLVYLISSLNCLRTTFTHCNTPGQVAITFDDGPHPENTNLILDVLKEENVTVTFFIIGIGPDLWEWDESRYNQTITRIFNEGHQIGSHSYNHKDLPTISASNIRSELSKVHNHVSDLLGVNMTVFRPPFGRHDDILMEIAQDEFNYKMILWNLDTEDWVHPRDVQAGLEHYVNAFENLNSNSSFIVLHHDFPIESVKLARHAIQFVKEKGFKVVPVSTCIDIPMYQ